MIRRTVVFTGLVATTVGLLSGTATADTVDSVPPVNVRAGGYVLCAWNIEPVNIGLCIGL